MSEDFNDIRKSLKKMLAKKIPAARKNIASPEDSDSVGSEVSPGASQMACDDSESGSSESSQDSSEKIPAARKPAQKFVAPKAAPVIFDDTDVCRLLRVKKRVLVNARKLKVKGSMWNIIGHHAGMTEAWILSQDAFADVKSISEWAIKPDDGVVTVEIVARTTNSSVVKCKRLSDEAIVSVWFGNETTDLPNGAQFDAIEAGGHLKWSGALNSEIY